MRGCMRGATMNTRIAALVTVVTMSLAAVPSAHEDKPRKVAGRFSGTAIPSTIDLTGDGFTASHATFEGDSNLGRFSLQALIDATRLGPGTCPNGDPGILFQGGQGSGGGVFRLRSGDLLVARTTSTILCA